MEEPVTNGLKQRSWVHVPQELLWEVLLQVESSWPLRKSVVACAGVCRSRREIVKPPEVSTKITFSISVTQVCSRPPRKGFFFFFC
ncbi:tubby-like F-box protein 3 [Prosopis cineraria]|uniref:tubby-like F-box protein 3 n=1 Tax=Prosopis cineraria TaxID=364024 RepID=UPI002410495A|nr:tubby-like F-box protein 3 [Prosopis cineraria]